MSRLIDLKTGWRKTKFNEKLIEKCADNEISVLMYDCNWNDSSCADDDYMTVQNWCEKYGIYLESTHLCLGDTLDLSLTDTMDKTIEVMKKQIYHAGQAGLKYAVVHASAEPVSANEREERLKRSADNIAQLSDFASRNDIILCVEDLPRSCLCNDIGDISYILSQDNRLCVCLDTNHLFKCTHEAFISAFGSKIKMTHISDYDYVNECHSIPGDGKINWHGLKNALEKADYQGAFLYESDVDRRDGKPELPMNAYRKIHMNISNDLSPLYGLE